VNSLGNFILEPGQDQALKEDMFYCERAPSFVKRWEGVTLVCPIRRLEESSDHDGLQDIR
jgi:hypothetical protein